MGYRCRLAHRWRRDGWTQQLKTTALCRARSSSPLSQTGRGARRLPGPFSGQARLAKEVFEYLQLSIVASGGDFPKASLGAAEECFDTLAIFGLGVAIASSH